MASSLVSTIDEFFHWAPMSSINLKPLPEFVSDSYVKQGKLAARPSRKRLNLFPSKTPCMLSAADYPWSILNVLPWPLAALSDRSEFGYDIDKCTPHTASDTNTRLTVHSNPPLAIFDSLNTRTAM